MCEPTAIPPPPIDPEAAAAVPVSPTAHAAPPPLPGSSTAPPSAASPPPLAPDEVETSGVEHPLEDLRAPAFLEIAAAWLVDWFFDDGRWYLGSAVFHAVLILCLGLISTALPSKNLWNPSEAVAAFDATEVERTEPAETRIAQFEVGDPPLDPTRLDAETLAMNQALPTAPLEAIHYDDSAEFVEAGGGFHPERSEPYWGGSGGPRIAGRSGPAGGGGLGGGIGGHGFASRGQGHRAALAGVSGGTRASERAVAAALNWIARHQTAQGRWKLDFHAQCRSGTCSCPGTFETDAAATGMALLPFLGAGQTHKAKGPYQQTISKAIYWLVAHQAADGDLSAGGQQQMYSHALAAIALCEAYGMTQDESVGRAAQRAVLFIENAQNEECGGWRYRPKQYGDTSVYGWQIMALKSAQLAGLSVSSSVLERAKKWLDIAAAGHYGGLYCYQPDGKGPTPTMTAVGMLCRQYMGLRAKDASMLEGKTYLLENPPSISLDHNCYYWYYATMAMHNFGDADWDAWNRQMRKVLIESQEKEGCAAGSWDPSRPTPDYYGRQGGRLMPPSFNALTLEVYYRYLPLFQSTSPDEPSTDDGMELAPSAKIRKPAETRNKP